MTDRHAGYVVVLEGDLREDDAEATLVALKQIRGVLSVEPLTADPMSHLAEARARARLAEAFLDFYKQLIA